MLRDQRSFRPRCLTADNYSSSFQEGKGNIGPRVQYNTRRHTHTHAHTDTLIKMLISPVTVPWKKGKRSPYLIAERRVPEPIPVFGSQPAGDVSHKPGGRLPLLSARPAVTLATLQRAATNFAAW